MTDQTGQQPSEQLAEIFSRINMSELPAMSNNVRELISLTHSSRSAANELAKAILKDYSLTNKVLQVVNSAYYSLGQRVTSISRAVTVLGLDAVRDLAMAIALFEDFLKSGVDKDGISKVLTKSFLSALQAKEIVEKKKMKVSSEEAFICSLFHNLGRIILCLYLPDKYYEIEAMVATGVSEKEAARKVLDGVDLDTIGIEVARFWNLSEKVVGSMESDPEVPSTANDERLVLKNIASFSNKVVDRVCCGQDLEPLLARYGQIIRIDKEEAFKMIDRSIEASEDVSDSMRFGLAKLKIRSRLRGMEKGEPPPGPKKQEGGDKKELAEKELPPLPVSNDKSVNDFVREITETLTGDFKLNDFYLNLLEGLYRGIGFDRVILAIVSLKTANKILVGRFGLGDISQSQVAGFTHPLVSDYLMSECLARKKDVTISGDSPGAFPENLRLLVKGRRVCLLPLTINNKPIGMIYMDRLAGRPELTEEQYRSARLLRDLAIMAIQKMMMR
ncbi:MAG: HDOD domain-containing protein [Proteobacteria bacterium]|nr:HDOD domain-containing protein [Pseudomonadota bacterium]MBU1738703.1 HDOD domain-containing protein [Pseudomonadota bacterium]